MTLDLQPPELMKPIAIALLFAIASCAPYQPDDALYTRVQNSVQWGYHGEDGPERWAELSPAFALCSDGEHQSPIDIPLTTEARKMDLTFSYRPSNLSIVNNGHTVQINHFGNSYVEIDGKRYELRQFHFHTPSEHTVEGRHFPMELHLVHQSRRGKLAVVAVMLEEGAESPSFTAVWEHLPSDVDDSWLFADVMVDPADLLPADRRYYHYEGSLTTPPCSEDVEWFVLGNPVGLADARIHAFRAMFDGNNRPLQPLKNRKIVAASR